MHGTWHHLYQSFSAEQRILLFNMSHRRHSSKWPCSCYHPLYVTYSTRYAGMVPCEDETIPQRIKSSFKMALVVWVFGLVWFLFVCLFSFKEKKEAISSFLERLGRAESYSSTQPELGLGSATLMYHTAAPAPASMAEPGSD